MLAPAMTRARQNIRPITRLRAHRLGKGLTIAEAATALDVTERSLIRWEQTGGIPQNPAAVKRITEFYGVKVGDLWPVEDVAA